MHCNKFKISLIAFAITLSFSEMSLATDISYTDTDVSTGSFDNFNIHHNIDEFHGDAVIGLMEGGPSITPVIEKMYGNARVEHLTSGAQIQELSENATIGIIDGTGFINTMVNGTVEKVNGGDIMTVNNGQFNEINGGRIHHVDNAQVDHMSAGYIGVMHAGDVTQFTGGQIGTLSSGATIENMSHSGVGSPPWLNTLDGGKIISMSGGTVATMTSGIIEHMSTTAFINNMISGQVTQFSGGQIGVLNADAKVVTMNYNGIGSAPWVDLLNGGEITTMLAGTVNVMQSGQIGTINNGRINVVNSGSIGSVLGNSYIDTFNDGTITDFSGGQIGFMNSGIVQNMTQSAFINYMTNGKVNLLQDNAYIGYFTGGEIVSIIGGSLGDIASAAKATFNGDATGQTGGNIIGSVENGADLTLVDTGNGGFVFIDLETGKVFDGVLQMQGGTAKIGHADFGSNNLFAMQTGNNNIIWVSLENIEGLNVSLASGISGELKVDNDLTATLKNLHGENDAILNKTGAGTLTLTNSGNYAGDININAGILNGEGTLLGKLQVNQNGKLSVGSETHLGVLNVGQLTLNNGSEFEVKAYEDGTSDRVNVDRVNSGNGTAVIENGSKLIVENGSNSLWVADKDYTIITATDGLAGQFSDVSWSTPFLDYQVKYDYDNFVVQLTPNRNQTSFCSVAGTFNQCSTANGIESLASGNIVYDVIANAASAELARNAYDNLSGEINASLKSTMLYNSRYPRLMVERHIESKNSVTPSVALNDNNEAWVDMWLHDGHLKNDGNAARINQHGWGFMLGADLYEHGETVVGAAVGYSETNLNVKENRSSNGDVDAVHAMLYMATKLGPIAVKGGIGYSWLDIDTHRSIVVPSLESSNSASYKGNLWQAFIEGSHKFIIGEHISVTPYGNVIYQRIKTNDFTESASLSATALHQKSSSDDMTLSTVGLRSNWYYDMDSGSNFYTDFSWQHNWSSQTPESYMRFDGGSTFTIRGTKVDRNSMIIGAGANVMLTQQTQLSIGYEGIAGNQITDNAARVQLQYAF